MLTPEWLDGQERHWQEMHRGIEMPHAGLILITEVRRLRAALQAVVENYDDPQEVTKIAESAIDDPVPVDWTAVPEQQRPSIMFNVGTLKEVIRLGPEGRFYFRGQEVETGEGARDAFLWFIEQMKKANSDVPPSGEEE